MHLTALTAAISLVISVAQGVPAAKRTLGGVTLCTDTGFGGTCTSAVHPLGACVSLAGTALDRAVASFGVDACTNCTAFTTDDCVRPVGAAFVPISGWFAVPGDGTGGAGTSAPWADTISSFVCELAPGC